MTEYREMSKVKVLDRGIVLQKHAILVKCTNL